MSFKQCKVLCDIVYVVFILYVLKAIFESSFKRIYH